ncbi:uncharacterized protein J4E79_002597 [Alternaria viburni]|uniref:uncharacterized protein n=1 Tax=Alternaria viburni TaxID=566460 RepID=UPI0020C343BB|nr:uncharacterized protein J4E79_002597 [Alternaria viburni]KAI4666558.1 hypothetical protein J4E79_002597 [Alternaria viburni]
MAPFCQRPTQLNINVLIQFPFLDNFTKATGFVGSFGCGTKQQRLSITSDPLKANPGENLSTLREGISDAATHWIDITRNALVQNSENIADPVRQIAITTAPLISPGHLSWKRYVTHSSIRQIYKDSWHSSGLAGILTGPQYMRRLSK